MNDKVDKFLKYQGISIDDIPNIPLYMDQLLGFFDNYIKVLKINDEDKLLTKTMVNNYVKAGVLNPPNKKKYDKDQLMLLTMIFQMKNILSISDLKEFLEFHKQKGIPKDIESIYKFFKQVEEKQIELLKEENENIKNYASTDKEVLEYILDLVVEANIKKRFAEMLLAEAIRNKGENKEKI